MVAPFETEGDSFHAEIRVSGRRFTCAASPRARVVISIFITMENGSPSHLLRSRNTLPGGDHVVLIFNFFRRAPSSRAGELK